MSRAPFLIGVSLVLSLLPDPAAAQSAPTLESVSAHYNEQYQKRLDQATAQRQDLYAKYATALEGLRQKAETAGDLEGVIALEKEILLASKTEQVLKTMPAVAGLGALRETLAAERAKIATAAQADLDSIRRAYGAALQTLVADLTRLGEVERANQARTLLIRLAQPSSGVALAGGSSPATSTSPGGTANTASTPAAAGSDLMSKSPIKGVVTLPPGKYSISGKFLVGDRESKTDGTAVTVAGTTIEGGSILVTRGAWKSADTLFRDTRLQSDLAWTVEAERSLFDNVEVGKGGAWGSGAKFASKSRFTECVFAKKFLPKWAVTATGIRAERCTFRDLVFPSIVFQEGVSEDVAEEWLTLKDCHFIDCILPADVLLITEDSYFERCTFLPPPMPLEIKKSIRVTLQVQQCGAVPDLGDKVQFKIVEGQVSDPGKVGSPIPYSYLDKVLNF